MGSRLAAGLIGSVVLLAGALVVLAVAILRSSEGPGSPAPGEARSAAPSTPTARVFDADVLSSTIRQQFTDKFGDTDVQVRCPAGEPVQQGRVFTCDLVGRPAQIEVTVVSDDGDYTWRPTAA